MQKNGGVSGFFSRASVPGGNVLRAERLYDVKDGWKAYILAGGTVGMKTALLLKIKETLDAREQDVETVCNTEDIGCLDGLRIPGLRACVLDGLRFGGYSAACPGIGERVVGMDDCLDEEKLAPHRTKVLIFQARQLAAAERAGRFLSAAGNLLTDNTRLAMESADLQKIDDSAARLAHRLFPRKERLGTESIRFLTAVTADGVQSFCAQTAAQFSHVYILEDEFGVGRVFLSRLRDAALKAGQQVISCPCTMFPQERPEHLLLPELSIAFFTSCRFHPVEGYRHIHMRRFLDHDVLAKGRARVSFNRKAAREFIRQAALLLGEAREDRRTVQEFYDDAVQKNVLNALAEQVTAELLARSTERAPV